MSNSELFPVSFFEEKQEVIISYRGRLAKEACDINVTGGKSSLLNDLIMNQFAGCLCYWEGKNTLVVGLIEDAGLYYPYW